MLKFDIVNHDYSYVLCFKNLFYRMPATSSPNGQTVHILHIWHIWACVDLHAVRGLWTQITESGGVILLQKGLRTISI